METEELQRRINDCNAASDMTFIAQTYLKGMVLRDVVAAEAWLMRAIESDDPVYSPLAMGILATEILKKETVIPEKDANIISEWAKTATGREKEELDALLKLMKNRQ